jgi:hypothetical protein
MFKTHKCKHEDPVVFISLNLSCVWSAKTVPTLTSYEPLQPVVPAEAQEVTGLRLNADRVVVKVVKYMLHVQTL